MDINSITLSGRIGHLEVKAGNAHRLVEFKLGVSTYKQGTQKTAWFPCKFWQEVNSKLELKVGMEVVASGRLEATVWQPKGSDRAIKEIAVVADSLKVTRWVKESERPQAA